MKGIGVSPGIAIGKAFILKKTEAVSSGILLSSKAEVLLEIERFDRAINRAVDEIEAIKTERQLSLSNEDLAVLETQIELITDPQVKSDVIEKIETDKKNANDALIEVIANFVDLFENMDDEYMQARSADIKDVGDLILKQLVGQAKSPIPKFEPHTIIIAQDISPSDTITMDTSHVTGFATQAGSKTSHTAIIAKSKGIPAVVGCGPELGKILNNDAVIVDGINGLIYINPAQEIIDDYTIKRAAYKQLEGELKSLKDKPAITTDGKKITLSANISDADDMEKAFENGGEGVGLLRTELLFMDRDSFPTENEQFEFYKVVALRSRNKPVIVRTIDIGGDKHLPYFNLPVELNPFLGYRAIRICLDRKDLFITQLKAILRASVFGDLKIMFPMISNVQEIRSAKNILEEAKAELLKQQVAFNADIKIGIMIEIPSAAITADILAKEIDFFSIGTNDLCQYTLAVDRMNEKISHLYDPFNPGVLRLISNVIEQGHKNNVHVGMCGEMASDPMATLLLLGMGLDDFSMSAASIPGIKSIIIKNNMAKAKEIYKTVMEMDSSEKITAYLQEVMQ
ncbi:phosphoenolpyruvate--protein phosphotransferase [Mucilaginibacter sp. McL0603]|uniref:phosphoenolpyruvate--protein phosphotransferase n=1 Tax=Mucilaginibacter sp. McL0603 TaxID=3415670 RepID=UPI003CEB12C6